MLLFSAAELFNAILDYWNSGRNVHNDTHELQAQCSADPPVRLEKGGRQSPHPSKAALLHRALLHSGMQEKLVVCTG